MHYTQEPGPIEGRADFVRENAVSLLEQRDEKIRRLRQQVRRLEASRAGMRREIARLQAMLAAPPTRPDLGPASPSP